MKINIKYFIYKALKITMIPFAWIWIAFHDARAATVRMMRKDFKEISSANMKRPFGVEE